MLRFFIRQQLYFFLCYVLFYFYSPIGELLSQATNSSQLCGVWDPPGWATLGKDDTTMELHHLLDLGVLCPVLVSSDG